MKDVNRHEAIYKFLRLNKVRLRLLLESCIWDRRLNYLLASDLTVVGSKTIDHGVPEQTCMGANLEADGLGITVKNAGCVVDSIPHLEIKPVTSEEANGFHKEVPSDEQGQGSRKVDGSSSSAPGTEVGNSGNGILPHDSSKKADVSVHSHADDDNSQVDLPKFVPSQADKVIPITDVESSFFDSNISLSGKSSFRLSFSDENDKGWIWTQFTEIQNEYMNDLWRGYLPKLDSVTSLAADMTSCKLIIDEGSKLHIPLGTDDYVVSDYEDEFSSIIACGLALLKDLPFATQVLDEDSRKEKGTMMLNDNSQSFTRMFSLASPHWSSSGYLDSDGIHSSSSMSSEESRFSSFDGLDLLDSVVSLAAAHPEVSMGIGKVPGKRKYSVICLYSSEFHHLRSRCCGSEVDYIASLSRCRNWDAKGGKSKSFFAKTLDDRFIIKEIKKTEFEAFIKFAPSYFRYMNECYENGNQTCLAKILGIYQVGLATLSFYSQQKEMKLVLSL